MTSFRAVLVKELYLFFASPIFYVAAVIFILLEGYFFYSAVNYFHLMSFQAARNPNLVLEANLSHMVLTPLLRQIGLLMLFISPLLTMRLYADERRSGTIELLFTLPFRDSTALLAKCMATYLVFLIMLCLSVPGILILDYLGEVEWGVVLCGYLGLMLMGAAFTCIGCLASAVTENQVVAAVISFGVLLLSWVINWSIPYTGPTVGEVFRYLSLFVHFNTFVRGLVDSRSIVFYVMVTVFFFVATLKVLELRRLKG